jgi:precorrin-6Y C5,15-methyltransferase (decarboxylating)
MKNRLYIIGVGPGDPAQLTFAAAEAIRAADCVVAADRHICLVPENKKLLKLGCFEETFGNIERALNCGSAAVLVSGDTGIYSLTPLLRKRFQGKAEILTLPGVSSPQYLCAAVGERWDDAAILSVHGREIAEARILDAVDRNARAIFLCGPDKTPQWLCRLLNDNGLGGVRVTVGERLSYSDQTITTGPASELADKKFDALSVVLTLNSAPWKKINTRPRDKDFLRTEVPMTRECVRSAVVDMLELAQDSVLWDIGAGTGSVSAASAMQCRDGAVFAVEQKDAAAELIRNNMRKFHLHNVKVIAGDALEVIQSLQKPTHVFIGGSGAELPEIINFAARLGAGIRIVVSSVTLKTYSLAAELLSGERFEAFEAQQISVSSAKKVGGSVIMAAQNPVTLFAAVTKGTDGKGVVRS